MKGGEIEDGIRYDEPEPLNFSVYQWLGDALHEAEPYSGQSGDGQA